MSSFNGSDWQNLATDSIGAISSSHVSSEAMSESRRFVEVGKVRPLGAPVLIIYYQYTPPFELRFAELFKRNKHTKIIFPLSHTKNILTRYGESRMGENHTLQE